MKSINAHDLKIKLEQERAVVIDVREPAEFRSEHILNSFSIPQSKVSVTNLPTRDKSIVFVCRSGKRSSVVCENFVHLHPDIDVYSLHGGINAWKDAGYDVVNFGRRVIPLDRQIQLVAGTLVFLGVVIGFFVTPAFYLLSGFVGCGLMFAGLTGWCGMGKILAMMPWNK